MIIASLYHCPLDDTQIAHDMSCAIIKKIKYMLMRKRNLHQ